MNDGIPRLRMPPLRRPGHDPGDRLRPLARPRGRSPVPVTRAFASGTPRLRACSGPLPRVKLYVDGQWSDQATVFLHDGENEIGVGYYSIVDGREEWVGFDWITINYHEVTPIV